MAPTSGQQEVCWPRSGPPTVTLAPPTVTAPCLHPAIAAWSAVVKHTTGMLVHVWEGWDQG